MQDPFSTYIPLIYLFTAIPYAVMGLDAWRKRPAVAVTPFAWIMFGMSFWSFTYGLEIFFSSLSAKLWTMNIEYVGIVIVPVFLLFFAFEYTGKSHLLTTKIKFVVWAPSLLVLILVWTNPFHHLMWSGESVMLMMRGLSLLDIKEGVFFWIHAVYSYCLSVVASLILIMELLQHPGAFRMRVSLVILAILAPLAGSLMFVLDTGPFKDFDFTPLLFLPAALGLSWTTTRYRLLEVLPLEHLTVLKNMRDGVLVMNSQRRILYINPTAEILFNRTEDKAIGQPLERVAGPYAEKLIPHLADGGQHVEITVGKGEDSRVYEVLTSSIASLGANLTGAPDTMITLHDVTHRKMTEIDLNRRNAVMSAVSLAAEVFLKEAAWEHNIPAVLEKIGYAVDVSRVFVVMNYLDDKKELFSSLCYEWAAPDIKPQINNPKLQHVPLRQAGFERWEKGLSQGEHLLGDVKDFPENERNFFTELESVSIAVVPIFVENQWWGFLMFEDCKQERYWTDMEVKAFHTMANIFGSAESRARTEQKLLWRQKTLSLLQTIVHDALQADTLNSMAQSIVDRLSDLIGADGCFLTSWDEVSKKALPLAAYGLFHDKYVTLKLSGKITFTESALQAGHTLVVDDVHNSPYVDPEISSMFPSESVIVLPLFAGGRKLGAIIISFDRQHRFQVEEIAIAEQAASLIALAFEKFQAMEQAQTRAATSEKLRMAGTFIIEAREMDDVVRRILDQLKEVVTYDSASVQVLDGDELEIFGGNGWNDLNQVIGIRFPIPGDNPNTAVIQSGKACLFNDIGKVYKDFRKSPHNHIHSWLGVPLIAQNKVLGLLAIDSIELNHFKPSDVELATVFADQVAVVLEDKIRLSETETLAITDALTNVYNRRGLFQLGTIEFENSIATGADFSAIMIDVDRFKTVNDTYGHDAGDKVLKELVESCRNSVREIDLVGRYGGEEIVILLPDTDLDIGVQVAERLRAAIANLSIQVKDDLKLHVTASLGVSCRDKNTDTLALLIARADQAMYVAKHKGRNRVAVSR